jgi:hypothetical protein
VDRGVPVISVDTKKKELIGNFKNGGREWQPKGKPDLVDVHDFPSDAVGKAIPYGVYDLAANDGFVSVGVDHDTPVFAVKSIGAWWKHVGKQRYRDTREIAHLCARWSSADDCVEPGRAWRVRPAFEHGEVHRRGRPAGLAFSPPIRAIARASRSCAAC